MGARGQPHANDEGPAGTALARGWLSSSQFVGHLGIEVKDMEPDRAVLSMPFTDSLPTMEDVIHGGAISSLADTAAAAAAWSGAEVPKRPRASTVGITVDFLSPARGQSIVADARVIRRAKNGLCFIEVKVATEDNGTDVAIALVTYQL